MPSFAARVEAEEQMDDFSIDDARLGRALENLRLANRWLGGYAATMDVLTPWMHAQIHAPIRLLDLATGAADFPAFLVRWAARRGIEVEIVAIDANPVTAAYARDALDRTLPARLRPRVRVETADALALDVADDAFDVVTASLFMHHLSPAEAVVLLREMDRVARHGVLVNDLHRHPLAYFGLKAMGAMLPVSPMFRHDGPVSVLRAFRRAELRTLAEEAGLTEATIRWHWAFRWTLSTLDARAR